MKSALVHAGAFFVCAVLAVGCHKNPEDTDAPATSALPQPRAMNAKPAPIDHVEPGALIEGSDKVYALPLPYGFHVSARTGPITTAYGDAAARQAAVYVQARVRDGSLVEHDGAYLFSSVRLPAEPNRVLNIEIDRVRDFGAQIIITDKTPPPDLGASKTPTERMKQVGLDSNGRIADPSHLE